MTTLQALFVTFSTLLPRSVVRFTETGELEVRTNDLVWICQAVGCGTIVRTVLWPEHEICAVEILDTVKFHHVNDVIAHILPEAR